MLDFLRRKDKRKLNPEPALGHYASTSGNGRDPQRNAAHGYNSSKSQQSQPLRDRNPTPAASNGVRRQNTRVPAASSSRRGKENATSGKKSKLKEERDRDRRSTEQIQQLPHRRWGKRADRQQDINPTAGNSDLIDAKKRKQRKQRQQKHEPTVLNKAVTSDRRRSVKVASPAQVGLQVDGQVKSASKTTAAQVPSHTSPVHKSNHTKKPSSDSASGLPPKNAPTNVAQGLSHERDKHERAHQLNKTSQDMPAIETTRDRSNNAPQQPQPTWPHIDLAELLQKNEVSSADIAVRRIAAAASRDDATRLKMIREGVASSLITLLRHEETTLDMRRDATFAIAELAVLEACEDPLVAAGTIPVLVFLINPVTNPDKSALGSACRGLRNLLVGKEATAVEAAKYGCVQPLLAIMAGHFKKEEEGEIVVEAAAAISNISNHGSRFQSYVIKHGGLSSLASLGMRTEDDEAMFHVVNVIAEFAREARWHKSIVAKDGLLTAFRALRLAKDPEVIAEASRLIGNVAVTNKARTAVREAGGLQALIDRLNRCKSFKDVIPVFDIVRALANVCVDGRAATEALNVKDGATVLLNVYTAQDAPEKLIRTALHALQVLAHGSATRRAKVLYSVGLQVKRAALAGLSVKRLYDLRQAILEDIETGDRNCNIAMPESLERLSRASVRMINSGVVNCGRGPQPEKKIVASENISDRSPYPGRPENGQINQLGNRGARAPDNLNDVLSPERLARKSSAQPNRFRSTGRIVSVKRNRRPQGHATNVGHLATEKNGDEDDYHGLPRGNEEAIPSEAELRARMLEREADGDMAQDFFEIGQVLGKGGYGSVFMAKDVRTGELVAIKRFHNSGALVDKKAIKEQNIWKGLHHHNVVEFKGSFVGDNGTLNLVVEYVDGLSLAEHLSQYSAFPETLVAEIARQVLCGLQYLHGNGVTHRDLKPANILVDHSAAVKICDFGVSRSENVQTINPGQQHMVGTPWYIAPEMVEYRPYTTSVDIWSLGCTVLELATGRRPYHELSAMQVLFRMVEDRCPPIPSHLSPEAKSFLQSCWVWDPQERPSASDLLKHPFILKARKFSESSKQSSATPSTPESVP